MANYPKPTEQVDHPTHYNECPSGVETIKVIRHMNHNRGAAMKYVWRAGAKVHEGETPKQATIRDLKKAIWYLKDEIERIEEFE